MKKLYFAFGSNMLTERIEQRVGKVQCMGAFSVPGWRLVFNAGDGKTCYANMTKSDNPSHIVMGVLYALTPKQMRQLDMYEGAPNLYTRMVIGRRMDLNRDIFAYVSINPGYTQQEARGIYPAKDYIELMIAGYEQHKLPSEIDHLRNNILPKCIRKRGVMI